MRHVQYLTGNAEAAAALAAYKEKHPEPADMSNNMDSPSGLTQVGGIRHVLPSYASCCLRCRVQFLLRVDVLVYARTDVTVSGDVLQAQERALKELNILKNGRDTLDMSVLEGCTDDNLRTRIGEALPALAIVFESHVSAFNHGSLVLV